ncbi:putative late blight resistance protein homolog R1A-4 [Salvia miltiorrhiza]|uniref:putative late blight resistance protein homolog R1A-4 n=1 Tax=Salvia miltiorrhiza TaxID=226208 RepID=UPI0025ACCC72|nr:putative late blight resistance protein homolog R1A-4 [Salvia miltiorrhiza]
MAAYGAATSLKNTIHRILQSSSISHVSHSPQILQPAYDEMDRLQRVLLGLDETSCSKIRTEVNALDERIKEAVWEFEDLLESHILPQILPQLESERHNLSFSVDLQSLQHSVDCFVEKVKTMEVEYFIEVKNMPEEEGEPISSRIDSGGMIKSKMVGLSDEFEHARDYLLQGNNNEPFSIIGMAGVGKTTLAKHIFEDPSIRSHFEFRAWVKVGRKCESDELLRCILAQVDPNAYQMLTQGDDEEEELIGVLKERLRSKKCLVVLDDVWEIQATNRLIDCLQEENILGRIGYLLTSRQQIIYTDDGYERVGLLNEEDSKELLGEKVFGEEGFPPQLEKLGEKIAEKCEGLPLMIITVAELLSKTDKTPEYWTEVLKQRSSVFVDAYNQISKVLFPSYDYLPQHFKMLFLYMGACPYNDIHTRKFINQLTAEGFLQPNGKESFQKKFATCLTKLSLWYHLVLDTSDSLYLARSYRVHSCWQHLCKEEGSRIKFLHVIQSCDDVIRDQRRLCVHWNSLFCFKQVCDSIKSDCASNVRSLLCYGPYHPYPILVHAMGLKLLKVLHALDVRFYHIPIEILKLVCLQYIALTCNGDLPTSISNLFHLQFLIIGKHMSIKKRGVQSYMPVQIWDMQKLEYLEIWGSDLPTPNSDATLNKLSILYGVSANSCTREVLKRIPNLRVLEIEVVLKPYDDDETNPLSCLSYISQLQNLRTLGYGIRNPELKYEFNTIPLSMFPSSLRTLVLRGLGYPWKYLNAIGSMLPNLKILVLKSYAFRGPEWEIESGGFLKLTTLQIEDTDLVQWRPQRGSFPKLRKLSMQHCYKLQKLDWPYDHSWITQIELVDCNPLAVTCANQLYDKFSFQLIVESSF